MNKAQISLEFMFAILLLLIILSLFISTNIFFNNKINQNINYDKYNTKYCEIKENYIIENNGEILNDKCKQQSTNNDS
jgi:uncharacterized protein (UPF0333 family)